MNIIPKAKTRSLAATLVNALVWALLTCAAVTAMIVPAAMKPMNLDYSAPEHSQIADNHAPVKGSQAWVAAKNDCTPTADGALPTGVIVSEVGANSGWKFHDSQTAVGHAFEQLVFDGVLDANEWTKPVDHGIRVGILCA